MEDFVGTRLELTFKARDLLDLDYLSKSDPRLWVYIQDNVTKKWIELGSTEQIDNNLNPVWSKPVIITYLFEEIQHIRFDVYDIDDASRGFEAQDFIGRFECTVGQIVGSKGSQLAQHLRNEKYPGRSCGVVIVSAEEVVSSKTVVHLKLRGAKLDRKDFFGKSDPFLRIFRQRQDNQFAAVYSTPVQKNTLDPQWEPFELPLQRLCNGEVERMLKVDCIDWNRSGAEKLIGSCTTSVAGLLDAAKSKHSLLLINPAKTAKRGYKNSGFLFVDKCDTVTAPSFVDYVQGGCELCLVVAIDFTASNGRVTDPQSLHYFRNLNMPNDYVQAISQVGAILQNYDSDQLYPVYGFGAKIPPHFQVSHCFPLTFNPNQPEVGGVEGIIGAYYQAINNVQLYGPTNFAPVINQTAQAAQGGNQEAQKYTILLIITDGVITDMAKTKDAIVAASGLPFSIVIVGVGNADFEPMNVLDADDVPLRDSHGRRMQRDIVQFVPFRNFKGSQPGMLARAVLEEIPDQVVGYFKSNGITPNPRQERDASIASYASDQSMPYTANQPTPYTSYPRGNMYTTGYPSQNGPSSRLQPMATAPLHSAAQQNTTMPSAPQESSLYNSYPHTPVYPPGPGEPYPATQVYGGRANGHHGPSTELDRRRSVPQKPQYANPGWAG